MNCVEMITKSADETKRLAILLAKKIKKQAPSGKALIIGLEGDLGSGKTTFIQGLAEGLNVKENVLSPTFLILKQFSISKKQSKFENLYHIDAYRLKNSEELLELGFEDLIKSPKNLIVVEWAGKVKKILPKDILRIKFTSLGKNKRKITNAFISFGK